MKRLALPLAGLAGLALAVVPALAADQTIKASSGFKWSPDTVTVNPGDTVTVENTSGGSHNLKWEDRSAAEIQQSSNWTKTRTFTAAEAGRTIKFVCEPHEDVGMVGSVVVSNTATTGTTQTTQTQPTQTTTTPASTQTTTQPSPPPQPPAPPGTKPEPGADRTPPSLTRASGRATRRGLTVTLRLDEAASVLVTVTRRGRRVASGRFEARSGLQTLRLARWLPRGALAVRLVAADAAGNRGAARTLRVRVP